MRKFTWLVHLSIIVILSATIAGIFYYLNAPRSPQQTTPFILRPGITTVGLAYDLQRQKIITQPQVFTVIVLLEGRGGTLQSGGYQIPPNSSLQQIIDQFTYGRIAHYKVTLVDGWSFAQVRAALAAQPYLQHEITNLNDVQVAQKLGLETDSPEGQFLPETYQYIYPDSDLDILQRAHRALLPILQAQWQQRSTGTFYPTPYTALIAASLIERESHLPAEFNIISGVIFRRLQKGMRLQMDSTVVYALGSAYTGKLSHADLQVDSPYNTYRVAGLPPTPIALCSPITLYAALHPDTSDALYFVADGSGGHQFSSTLQQQNVAVVRYLRKNLNTAPDYKK